METSSLGEKFGHNEKLYINENLTPYVSKIAWKC